MRFIQKTAETPAAIREWQALQEPVGLNLDYPSFNRKPELRRELIVEQFGLCAYTGAPLDERLEPVQLGVQNLAFQAHIEHIKPRSVCRNELEARGGEYGRVLCEDMDHRNLVAALEVRRKPPAKTEVFGAAAHGDELLPVTPVQPDCEQRFRFDSHGDIRATDAEAQRTIDLLRLDHETLRGWRRGAISAFFPDDEPLTRNDIEQRISVLTNPQNGRLPEFSFCVANYGRSLLNS